MEDHMDAVFQAAADYLANGDTAPPDMYMKDAKTRGKFTAALLKQTHAEAKCAKKRVEENEKAIFRITIALLVISAILVWMGAPNLLVLFGV